MPPYTPPPDRIYSPYELPANSAAFAAFQLSHPDAVNSAATTGQAQAQPTIQDHVVGMAQVGVAVSDTRLSSYVPPATAASVAPTSGSYGTAITITGTTLTGATRVFIGTYPCSRVTVVSATSVTAVTPPGSKKGALPMTVTVGQVNIAGPTFTVT